MLAPQHQGKVTRTEAGLHYKTRKPEKAYIWEALQVAGSGHNMIGGRNVPVGNKRLALLGDAVMPVTMIEHWYNQSGVLVDWDSVRQHHLSDGNLARVAIATGLTAEINCNPRQIVQPSVKMAANLLEALIGAVWLDSDGDMEAIKTVMFALGFGDVVDTADPEPQNQA
ncbi:hypothetical protein D6D06_09080 [Aureobasidium pullulans]|nr:hypothetical protein D6D06_09080 [Aureobasidium pullulans]